MGKKRILKSLKYVMLIFIAFIQVFPLYWLLSFSLKSNEEIFGANVVGLPQSWRWENYANALANSNIVRYFLNSVFYSVVTVTVAGILATMAAYALVRMEWKKSGLVMLLFTIGIMIPGQATLLPLFQILDKTGLKGGYLGLLIPYIVAALPMTIMILSGFLKSVPREIEEAACIDGCNIFRCFYTIIIPMIKSGLVTASIFTFLNTWNELIFANTFTDSDEFRTLPVGIMSLCGQYSTDWGLVGAGMAIATIPTIIIYLLLSDQVQESIVSGAVKG